MNLQCLRRLLAIILLATSTSTAQDQIGNGGTSPEATGQDRSVSGESLERLEALVQRIARLEKSTLPDKQLWADEGVQAPAWFKQYLDAIRRTQKRLDETAAALAACKAEKLADNTASNLNETSGTPSESPVIKIHTLRHPNVRQLASDLQPLFPDRNVVLLGDGPTNSIIARGAKGDLEMIEMILQRLDAILVKQPDSGDGLAATNSTENAPEPAKPEVVRPSDLKPTLDGKNVTMTFTVADTQLVGGSREGEFPSVLIHYAGRKKERLNIYAKGDLADILHRFSYVSPDDALIGRTITASGIIKAYTEFPKGEDQTPLYELELRQWQMFKLLPVRKGVSTGSAEIRREVYVARNVPCTDLAQIAQPVLKDFSTTSLAAIPISNCLVCSGPAREVEELISLLQELDRKPHQVRLTVRILESSNPKSEGSDQQLQGTTKDVVKRIAILQREGQLSVVNELRLVTLENQAAMVQVSERIPVTTGIVSGGIRGSSRSIQEVSVGTLLRATCRVPEGQLVLADLSVEKSVVGKANEGVVIGENSDGSDLRTRMTRTLTAKSTVRIPAGQTVALNGVQGTDSTGCKRKVWVLVSATMDH